MLWFSPGHFCGDGNCKNLVANVPKASETMDCCERTAIGKMQKNEEKNEEKTATGKKKKMQTLILSINCDGTIDKPAIIFQGKGTLKKTRIF